MKATLLLVAALVSFASSRYEGSKVYRFSVDINLNNTHLNYLERNPDFDFWTEINKIGDPITVAVKPKSQNIFEKYLKEHLINFIVVINDLAKSLLEDTRKQVSFRSFSNSDKISFDRYYSHAEMNAYLTKLARKYPDIVSIENIGSSFEKRDMLLIKISSGNSFRKAKPIIFVDAGIHAREWIAPATALYLIHQLVENKDNRNLIKDVDWIILPMVNPDGYEVSRSEDRLWRKTVSPGISCKGVDANRNFDYHWLKIGASRDRCSSTYAGPEAFSEIETRNLRDFLLKTDNIKAYLTVHSHGQYLLYPWGWSSEALPSNWRELDTLGHRVAKAIERINGTKYTVGSSAKVLYPAAGGSDDWAMGVRGIDIAYTIELPGGGKYGFDLPASRIEAVAAETFEGFKVFADYVANL